MLMFWTFLVGAILPTLSCQALWYGNNVRVSTHDGMTSNKPTKTGENYRIEKCRALVLYSVSVRGLRRAGTVFRD